MVDNSIIDENNFIIDEKHKISLTMDARNGWGRWWNEGDDWNNGKRESSK